MSTQVVMLLDDGETFRVVANNVTRAAAHARARQLAMCNPAKRFRVLANHHRPLAEYAGGRITRFQQE